MLVSMIDFHLVFSFIRPEANFSPCTSLMIHIASSSFVLHSSSRFEQRQTRLFDNRRLTANTNTSQLHACLTQQRHNLGLSPDKQIQTIMAVKVRASRVSQHLRQKPYLFLSQQRKRNVYFNFV